MSGSTGQKSTRQQATSEGSTISKSDLQKNDTQGSKLKDKNGSPKFNPEEWKDEDFKEAHWAAAMGFKDHLWKLINDQGADLSESTNKGLSVIDVILYQVLLDNFLCSILDSYVKKNPDGSITEWIKLNWIELNFKVLKPNGNASETEVLFAIISSPYLSREMRGEIVNHPIIISFISYKWRRVRYLFWMYFFIYFLFVATLTAYVIFLTAPPKEHPLSSFSSNVSGSKGEVLSPNPPFNPSLDKSTKLEDEEFKSDLVGSFFILLFHLVFSFILFIINSYMYLRRFRFFVRQLEAWIHFSSPLISVIWIAIYCVQNYYFGTEASSILKTLLLIELPLTFTGFMLLLASLNKLFARVMIFIIVLKRSFIIFLVSTFVVVGYSLSFYLEYREEYPEAFGNPWISIANTLVIMSGEFGYKYIYGESEKIKKLSHVSRGFFLTYVVMSQIVLLNLITNFAVSQVGDFSSDMQWRWNRKRAEYVDFFSGIFPKLAPVPDSIKLSVLWRRKCDFNEVELDRDAMASLIRILEQQKKVPDNKTSSASENGSQGNKEAKESGNSPGDHKVKENLNLASGSSG